MSGKTQPTPFARWAASDSTKRPRQPPPPTGKEWRSLVKDLRRLGELYGESQEALHALEKELAEARKEARALEKQLEAAQDGQVGDAGWERLQTLARDLSGESVGRALRDWIEDWGPAWAKLP